MRRFESKSKKVNDSIFWNPVVTSTPCKLNPSKTKEIVPHKNDKTPVVIKILSNHCEALPTKAPKKLSVSQRVRKTKYSNFFDVSSSEDEELISKQNDNKRIKIKIVSQNSSKMKESETVENKSNAESSKDKKQFVFKNKCLNTNGKTQKKSELPQKNIRSEKLVSEVKIPDTDYIALAGRSAVSYSKERDFNLINNSKKLFSDHNSCDNSCSSKENLIVECTETQTENLNKVKKKPKRKIALKSQSSKSRTSQEIINNDKIKLKPPQKDCSVVQNAEPDSSFVKKSRVQKKNSFPKKMKHKQKYEKNSAGCSKKKHMKSGETGLKDNDQNTILNYLEKSIINENNSSHQLFSKSTELELINSLHLSDDNNEEKVAFKNKNPQKELLLKKMEVKVAPQKEDHYVSFGVLTSPKESTSQIAISAACVKEKKIVSQAVEEQHIKNKDTELISQKNKVNSKVEEDGKCETVSSTSEFSTLVPGLLNPYNSVIL